MIAMEHGTENACVTLHDYTASPFVLPGDRWEVKLHVRHPIHGTAYCWTTHRFLRSGDAIAAFNRARIDFIESGGADRVRERLARKGTALESVAAGVPHS